MTRESKLAELGLEEEAYDLRHKDNKTWDEITEIINADHPEVYDKYGEPISYMGIKRGVKGYEKALMEKSLEEGGNPVDTMIYEFREAIKGNTSKINKLMGKIEKMVEKAEQGTVNDMARAYTVALKGWEQERRNWESLQQYGIQQVGNIGQINLTKEQNVKTLIINWTDKIIEIQKYLCDDCKERINELIDDLIRIK